MSFRIFMHSVRLVFSQFGDAIRVSGLLYLVTLVLSVFAFVSMPPMPAGEPPTLTWQLGLSTLISIVVYLWIAVGWHRFVLLDESPKSAVPAFLGDRLLAYLGRWLQVILIGALVGIVLGFLNGILAWMFGGAGGAFVAIVGLLVILTCTLLITYRLAPLFPGAAIGKAININGAWIATRGANGTLLVLAIISAIAAIVIDLPATALSLMLPHLAIVGFAWLCVTSWVKLMVGISVLTTLYGVYVEKRSIA